MPRLLRRRGSDGIADAGLAGVEVLALIRGDDSAWHRFVPLALSVIRPAVRRVLAASGLEAAAADVVQEVFLRLCRNERRLLTTFDPDRGAFHTWLRVVATAAALDHVRQKRLREVPLDQSVPPSTPPIEPSAALTFPPDLLSPRQTLILRLIYERDLDVADVARLLHIEPQTVRSLRHKALTKLRDHSGADARSRIGRLAGMLNPDADE